MRAVHVLFYRPERDDRWLNHLVTLLSPPFSHCDIQFEDEVASSIYQNETVYMCKKSFFRNNYERVSFTVTEDEYDRIYSYCENACRNMVAFDPVGMVGSFMPLYYLRPSHKTFCSRFVCEALQASGRIEFSNLSPPRMTPSGLFGVLIEANKNFIHVSGRRMCHLLKDCPR